MSTGIVLGAGVAAALAIGSIALSGSDVCGLLRGVGGFDSLPQAFTGIDMGNMCPGCEHFVDICFGNCTAGAHDACGCFATCGHDIASAVSGCVQQMSCGSCGSCLPSTGDCISGSCGAVAHGAGDCMSSVASCIGGTMSQVPADCGALCNALGSAASSVGQCLECVASLFADC